MRKASHETPTRIASHSAPIFELFVALKFRNGLCLFTAATDHVRIGIAASTSHAHASMQEHMVGMVLADHERRMDRFGPIRVMNLCRRRQGLPESPLKHLRRSGSMQILCIVSWCSFVTFNHHNEL
jgi:hypothetical protein